MLGPPGTAKSELARRLSSLTSGTYFERLLTRFSVPEELFGPLSMRGLSVSHYANPRSSYRTDGQHQLLPCNVLLVPAWQNLSAAGSISAACICCFSVLSQLGRNQGHGSIRTRPWVLLSEDEQQISGQSSIEALA